MMDISSRLVKRCRKFIEPYRVTDGRGFKLSRYDPGDLGKLGKDSKKEAVDKLEKGIELLEQLQEVLYASESHALLVVLQAMDSAGKDGIVKHVMGGVNQQGCVVSSFKQPSTLERSHDFLWRCVARLPRRGMIGIFNRSYMKKSLACACIRSFWPERDLIPPMPRVLSGRRGSDPSITWNATCSPTGRAL